MAKSEKKQKKQDPEVTNLENSEVIFTDYVSIRNVTRETVELDLCVKDNDNNIAKSTHRVIVTLPHFFRITQLFNNITDAIEEQVEKEAEENKDKD